MVKETAKSLKAENEKLKKRVEDFHVEDGHVESKSEDAKKMKCPEYLSKEYDDYAIFRRQVGDKLRKHCAAC
mgnify:FL=1